MTFLPKLVFFDLDGTLINKDGIVSEKTRHAITRLKSLGSKIAFASGRPVFSARELMDSLEVNAPSALFSSAVIYDPVKKEIVEKCPIGSSDLQRLVEQASKYDLYAEAYTTDGYYIERATTLTDIHYSYMKMYPQIAPLALVVREHSIIKFLVIAENSEEEVRMRAFMAEFPTLHFGVATGAAHPSIQFCNATNPQYSREKVFATIVNSLGLLPSDVMAFGDGESDITFLSLAGCGVAMGNAPERVKSAARYVTRSVEEDGVAHALSALVFGECAL